jgi:hypothetical protein
VLSGPPAFGLSQDQTLREEVVCRQAGKLFTLSLSSKVTSEDATRICLHLPEKVQVSTLLERSLLSFQRPVP